MQKALVNYFKSCYQSDYRAVSLLNFYSSKVEHPLILESAELLQGKMLEFPVSTDWGKKVDQQLAVYSKEKALYCCSFFMFGETTVAGKKQNIVAPLYLHTVELKRENEIFYISIDAENPIVNPAILQAAENVQTGLLESITQKLPKGFIQFDQVFEIEKTLKEFFLNLDFSKIENYPTLWTNKMLKDFQKKRKENSPFVIVPACGIAMLNKPTGSRGILNELGKMSERNDFSTSLNEIFGTSQKTSFAKKIDLTVPIVLNKSQENILKSAFANHLTLVIGPPGTGKSFTIAALAVELMSQGKSVLIASKNNQAGNVVADKIEKGFGLGSIVVRAGKKDYKKVLQKRLENLLRGIGLFEVTSSEIKTLFKKVKKQIKTLAALEKKITSRTKTEMERGDFLFQYQASFFQKIKMYFLTNKVEQEIPLWKKMFLLENELLQRNKNLKILIQLRFYRFLSQALNRSRVEVQDLVKAFKARTGNRKESIFEEINFSKILKALPIWVANSTAINKVLPLQKELFDVVIIDEATQCDIASSLPILQRGKSAVIVGDPKQLRHMSFLSQGKQNQLIEQFGVGNRDKQQLDYRSQSLLDMVSDSIKSQKQVHFLNEHFRSMPDIIQFSNTHFYDGKLDVMTACPATLLRQHVFLHSVNGQRNKTGYNKKEADSIFEMIKKIIEEERNVAINLCQSIGILSPFRHQVDYLQRQILKICSADELERHEILIGTPYAFQGEEKEVMFLSFALDDESHSAAFNYLNREDVFNVSITRARSLQYVFISFSSTKIKNTSLLARFIYGLENHNNTSTFLEEKKVDVFLEEVIESIRSFGIEEWHIAFPIAGTEIDLVVVHEGKTFCIDLIGFPGEFETALPIERWRMLERVGLSTFTLPFSAWYFDKEKCVTALKDFLK
ncbi:MAG: AAA domain-containing protein [Saprospiraceae bacterium]